MRSLIPLRTVGTTVFRPLRREMEDVFHHLFGEMDADGHGLAHAWVPRVDIEETDKEILVKTDLPGVNVKDVELTVADNTLILRGARKEDLETKKRNYYSIECFRGEFYREIPLPAGSDPEKIV